MRNFLFDPGAWPSVPVAGQGAHYPVRRIFCVGRNYVAHAHEMGGEVDREAPWYFTKSAHALVLSGETVPYAPGTENLHHEMELVMALGKPMFQATVEEAAGAIYGYAAGLDMTRRDRQQDGKDHRRPWSLGKDFENGAVIGEITQATDYTTENRAIRLQVNGETRQDGSLDDMVWSCEEIISHLSGYYHLGPGDLVYTGTPAGVGPVKPGDVIEGEVEGLAPISLTIGEPEHR